MGSGITFTSLMTGPKRGAMGRGARREGGGGKKSPILLLEISYDERLGRVRKRKSADLEQMLWASPFLARKENMLQQNGHVLYCFLLRVQTPRVLHSKDFTCEHM